MYPTFQYLARNVPNISNFQYLARNVPNILIFVKKCTQHFNIWQLVYKGNCLLIRDSGDAEVSRLFQSVESTSAGVHVMVKARVVAVLMAHPTYWYYPTSNLVLVVYKLTNNLSVFLNHF